jgi:hypothetical protein
MPSQQRDWWIVGVLLLAFVAWCYVDDCALIDAHLHGNRGPIYSAVAGVAGALLGFVMAAVAILLPYANDGKLEFLQGSPEGKQVFRDLWGTFQSALSCLGVTTLVSLIALVVDHDGEVRLPAHVGHVAAVITLALVLMSILRVGRCVWTLGKMLERVTTDESSEPGAGSPGTESGRPLIKTKPPTKRKPKPASTT